MITSRKQLIAVLLAGAFLFVGAFALRGRSLLSPDPAPESSSTTSRANSSNVTDPLETGSPARDHRSRSADPDRKVRPQDQKSGTGNSSDQSSERNPRAGTEHNREAGRQSFMKDGDRIVNIGGEDRIVRNAGGHHNNIDPALDWPERLRFLDRRPYVAYQVRIRFAPDLSQGEREQMIREVDGQVTDVDAFARNGTPLRWYTLELDRTHTNVRRVLTRLADRHRENIVSAEPNFFYTDLLSDYHDVNDPDAGSQWYLGGTDHPDYTTPGVDAFKSWSVKNKKQDITVAVTDTGMDMNHPEFDGKINHPIDTFDDTTDPSDQHGHGTGVSGLIGAHRNNSEGIAGIMSDVSLIPVKIFSDDGSSTTVGAITDGIDHAVNNGADVINASWGGSTQNDSIQSAIDAAGDSGVLFVTSAGNDGQDLDANPKFPAGYAHPDWNMPHVMAVASTNQSDNLSSFSDFGDETVNLAAPGSSIYTTDINQGYTTTAGTSFASPIVAAGGAILRGMFPGKGPVDIKGLLEDGVDTPADLAGDVKTDGRLNIYNSIREAIDPVITHPGINGTPAVGEQVDIQVQMNHAGTTAAGDGSVAVSLEGLDVQITGTSVPSGWTANTVQEGDSIQDKDGNSISASHPAVFFDTGDTVSSGSTNTFTVTVEPQESGTVTLKMRGALESVIDPFFADTSDQDQQLWPVNTASLDIEPVLPEQPGPQLQEASVSLSPDLQWEVAGTGQVDSYDLAFGKAGEEMNVLATGLSDSSFGNLFASVGPLEAGTQYEWQVSVNTPDSGTIDGDVWTFTTHPVAIPAGGERWRPGTEVTVRWGGEALPEDPQLELYSVNDLANPMLEDTIVSSVDRERETFSWYIDPATVQEGGEYFLRFVTSDGVFNSESFFITLDPVVDFHPANAVPEEGDTVFFFDHSVLPDTPAAEWNWDLYRGNQENAGETPDISLDHTGPLPVTLSVTEEEDASGDNEQEPQTYSRTRTFHVTSSDRPSPPDGFRALPADGGFRAVWPDTGQENVDWEVRYREEGTSSVQTVIYGQEPTVSYTITDQVSNGVVYQVDLVAVDGNGNESVKRSSRVRPFAARIGDTLFNDPGQALSSAGPGDTVHLSADTFSPAELTVPAGVHLRGVVPGFTVLESQALSGGNGMFLESGNAPSVISHLSLVNGTGNVETGISADASAAATVRNTIIRGFETGLDVPGGESWTVRNNHFLNHTESAVSVIGTGEHVFRNNLYAFNGRAIQNEGGSEVEPSYFAVFENGSDTAPWFLPGQHFSPYPVGFDPGNQFMNKDPRFRNPASEDWRLRADSPLVAAGHPLDSSLKEPGMNGSRINVGAFGNTFLAAGTTSLNRGPATRTFREVAPVVNLDEQTTAQASLSVSPASNGLDAEVSFSVPLLSNDFDPNTPSLFSVDILYRAAGDGPWQEHTVSDFTHDTGAGGPDQFVISGNTVIDGSNLSVSGPVEYSLVVRYATGQGSRVVDPATLTFQTDFSTENGGDGGGGGGGGGGPSGPLILLFLLISFVVRIFVSDGKSNAFTRR